MQTKMTPPKTLAQDSEQAIAFLTAISESLKLQRRHFDDAVVTHCVRLINDYVEEKRAEKPAESVAGRADAGHRP